MAATDWYQKQSYTWMPYANKTVTRNIPKTFVMHAGAFSAELYYRGCWRLRMTFGGSTDATASLCLPAHASIESAQQTARYEFGRWIEKFVLYAPHALNLLGAQDTLLQETNCGKSDR
jgi:hypothetical protein